MRFNKFLLGSSLILASSYVMAAKYVNIKCDVELYGGHRVIQYAELNNKGELKPYKKYLMNRKFYNEGKYFSVYKINECVDEHLNFKDKKAVEAEQNQAK